MDERIYDKLKHLNNCLREKENTRIGRQVLREALKSHIGQINAYSGKNNCIPEKYKAGGILGVDGSINSFGANFPYEISFFRGYAKFTKADTDGNTHVAVEDIFSPFYPEHREVIDEIVENSDGKTTLESALHKYKKDRLTEIELLTAIEGIFKFNPALVIMDGGFYRFDINTPDLWNELQELCIEKGIMIVGVIEEIATHKIAEILSDKIPSLQKSYDREVLFGTLNTNEWLKVNPDIEIKKGYYTTFARFSKHPQAIALDFLKEQIDNVDEVMSIINGLTPIESRGIPAWLDFVDREVRLTKNEIEVYLNNCLDRDLKEKFIIPNSKRRQY